MDALLPWAVVLAAVSTACTTFEDRAQLGRHAEPAVWSQAVQRAGSEPLQWAPAALLLLSVPAAFAFDEDWSDGRADNDLTGGRWTGDLASLALGGGALAWGGLAWSRGDGGASFEIAAESALATGVLTDGLKRLSRRGRPNHSGSRRSFPSGHTSFAFMGATFLAREYELRTGSSLGYLLYVPASAVALNRVEHERHWPSDVAFGALIGIAVTQLVFNAHEPGPHPGRPAIFARPRKFAWSVEPVVDGERLGLGLTASL